MSTGTVITDEPDRIEEENWDTVGKETEVNKIDSKNEGDQNSGHQISQEAIGKTS